MINCENFSTAANMKKMGKIGGVVFMSIVLHPSKKEYTASFLLFPGLFFIDYSLICSLRINIFYAIVMHNLFGSAL